ncbi:hypothetical protein C1I98_32610 [Spongiactinospora gelatinilytica]|uniref:Uncharacterized protein n=1 Tax=Spongiactinospora gelatinilytica TaxID=2666298 RepID=A0A2W2EXV6_9ACTN|nr:hypothetical protein C1I98_32610 [Spongiactinospora gelatinilytica]
MSGFTGRSNEIPSMYEDLVRDRIRSLHQEAEEQRMIRQVIRVRRARRDAERASARLRHALLRLG